MHIGDVKTMDDLARQMGFTFDGFMAKRVDIDAWVPDGSENPCVNAHVSEAWPTDFSPSGESIFGVAYRDTPDFLGERENAAAQAIQLFRLRESMTDAPTGVFGPFPGDGHETFLIIGHRRAARDEC